MAVFFLFLLLIGSAEAFFLSRPSAFLPSVPSHRRNDVVLFSGYGIATNYTWKEEAFEIELTVRVPQSITSKDIRFRATTSSIDLGYYSRDDDSVVQVLDPTRPLRGRVNLDGTYWMLGDDDDDNNDTRMLTVTIDKYIKTPSSDFEAVEFDWKGVYRDDDDKDEVSKRHYDVPEPLNVRDYAGRLGVDIDNMNMSMVDKTMFSSGLNVSQSALEEMQEAGYVSKDQVTQQGNGMEFVTDDESGEAVPYSLEKDILVEPQQQPEQATDDATDGNDKPQIHQQVRNFTRAAFAQDAAISPPSPYQEGTDPILQLSVEKLREVLRSQGLSADGSEKELRERLRTQVNTLLQKGSV